MLFSGVGAVFKPPCKAASKRRFASRFSYSSAVLVMPDLFDSPRRMLRRAKNHIEDLETRINVFAKEKPWTIVAEPEPDGVTHIWKLRFTKVISDDLPNIIFDAANNMRATLDQMAFAIGQMHTRLDKPKAAKFPFGLTESDMLNNLAGGCKDLPSEIQDLFRGFKPYKGGNNSLWAMNELCNTPKHQILYPVIIGAGTIFINYSPLLHGRRGAKFPIWDREKNELKFARIGPRGETEEYLNTSFAIVLDDVDEVIRNQQPVGVLNGLACEVERVLAATEAECRRIGLIA